MKHDYVFPVRTDLWTSNSRTIQRRYPQQRVVFVYTNNTAGTQDGQYSIQYLQIVGTCLLTLQCFHYRCQECRSRCMLRMWSGYLRRVQRMTVTQSLCWEDCSVRTIHDLDCHVLVERHEGIQQHPPPTSCFDPLRAQQRFLCEDRR